MNPRKTQEKRLKDAIAKCMILDDEDRNFWLKNVVSLPDVVLGNVTKMIEEKNKIMDEYIAAALKNDKDQKYLAKLKARIQKIKEKAFALDESKEKKNVETSLEEELKKLDE